MRLLLVRLVNALTLLPHKRNCAKPRPQANRAPDP